MILLGMKRAGEAVAATSLLPPYTLDRSGMVPVFFDGKLISEGAVSVPICFAGGNLNFEGLSLASEISWALLVQRDEGVDTRDLDGKRSFDTGPWKVSLPLWY